MSAATGPPAGRVVVLNGTSSAGKSTLAAALQARLAAAGECWLVIGVDDVFTKVPFDWVTYGDHVGSRAEEGIAFEVVGGEVRTRIGPVGRRALAAYRGWVVATARSGVDVIVDEVLLDEVGWHAWLDALAGLEVWWVGVDCALEIAEGREAARGDRLPGMARAQHGVVHRWPVYDARVDTGTTAADAAAAAVFDLTRRAGRHGPAGRDAGGAEEGTRRSPA